RARSQTRVGGREPARRARGAGCEPGRRLDERRPGRPGVPGGDPPGSGQRAGEVEPRAALPPVRAAELSARKPAEVGQHALRRVRPPGREGLLMDLGFLTPIAAVIAAAGLIPLALALLNHRRAARVRAVLGLEPAGAGRRLEVPVAIAAISGLLGIAAAQPVVPIDVSRSMLASATSTSATRLDRAKQAANELRARLADIPVGVATFT